jgi:hypothetical protein
MKSTALVAMALTLCLGTVQAAKPASDPQGETASAPEADDDAVEIEASKDDAESAKLASSLSDFCFFSGKPASGYKYAVTGNLKVGKGTYGGVKDILPKLANRARGTGADAIINYTGSQRFGFWPWRMVRPVVRGVGIKWADAKKPDCAAAGGTILKDILASDKAPAQ